MCDHAIGIFHELVNESQIKEILHNEAYGSNSYAKTMNALNHYKIKPMKTDYKAVDFLDRRRNLMAMFNYCPYCSAKINWKKIRKSL